MEKNHALITALCALVACFTALLSPSFAASSKWIETDGARIRLIALPSQTPNRLDAALQVELDKGWKTYWRSPGASGLPPQISFAGSSNVVSTKMDFPVPDTFGDGKDLTAGYTKSVIFPISVETLYQDRPVELKAKGVVGICSEICVPVPFEASLLEDSKGVSDRDVAAALFKSRLNLVETQRDDFRIVSAVLKGKSLEVTAEVPAASPGPVLMVEGPSNWYLTPVKATGVNGAVAVFEVDLTDIPEDAEPLKTSLKFTLVSDGKGVETEMVATDR